MPEQLSGRIEFWNIGYPLGAIVYLTALIALVAVGWALWKRFQYWRLGTPNPDIGPWWPRIRAGMRSLMTDGFAHRRFVRHERLPGIMHFLIFWGIIVLFIATTLSAVEFNAQRYLGLHMAWLPWKAQLEVIWDVGGVMLIAGLGIAAYRRYVMKPERLNTFLENGVLIALLFLMAVSGFLLQSLRQAATELEPTSALYNPEWAPWAIFSYPISLAIRGSGMSVYAMEVGHFGLWWAHAALMSAAFVYAAVRFGPLLHIFVSPANLFLRSSVTRPKGALRPMGDLETLETFGAKDITQFTTKQLLDFDACTNCGRCQDQCPAWASGKPLSPRKLIQDAKAYMEERAPVLLSAKNGEQAPEPEKSLIHDFITPEVLWACTSCRACMQACPVFVEHIDSIVDMRRYLTMEEANVPETAMSAMTSMEQRGHPWRGTQAARTDWMEGTSAVTMAEDPEHDVLLWVGCTAALDSRSRKIARAMASVLKVAGVRYRVLGNEETCTGDPARRMGNEYLYQMLAEQNIETLKGYEVKKILTLCPHCFNTLKNEYPQFDGVFEVVHYTEFVADLVKDGRIKPITPVDTTLAYHDSCYLGRHNDIYEPPRDIARAIPGLTLIEMGEQRCRERGFCCGAGGGRMWMEEEGTRVNHIRTDHFLETEAQTVGVSCPFCLQMMEEGISAKGQGDGKSAKDLLEVLADSLEQP
ncbi:MAG: heterodisulfide reductase-related iron-sulfur binding cluster, partial [Dehalococcoidia bacterium]